jgi:4-hydroxy-3-polyprenylbenzoate decarboxylase
VPNAPLAIMDITTLTHRADALLVLSPSTPQETRWMAKAAERLFLPLARLVLSEIHDMNVLLDELPGSIVLVSIRQHRHGVAQKVMFGVWGMGDLSLARIVVVVDDDVDVQDTEAVARHVAETVDWTHDAFHVEGMLHPAYGGYGGKMGVDATRKPNRVPRPAPAAPPSLLALLDERWRASRQ